MYEVDMLKKQGIPRKSTPLLTVIMTAAVSLPLILSGLFLFEYYGKNIEIDFNSKVLTRIEKKVSTLPFDERLNNRLKKKLGVGIEYPEELLLGIDKSLQWTPILESITGTLPENLAISEFDVSKETDRLRIEDPEKEGRKKDVEIVSRKLSLLVYNLRDDDGNESAEHYINQLNESKALKTKMKNAKIASIRLEEFGEYVLPCYVVECVFVSGKKQLEEGNEG
ncbi:hypothetical protein [Sedimentisphaera salicampi]|uniref:Uncharacterized protein n=1 Tax=Sedimentisphaera salicampi TaxID=1941349 RepID=A0A1W6LIY1_9BACT|nr:hypothetical protein [Sedimentisphaera salicampi]ARN55719.1 hypothetical protein STSP1_00083 [Sedimentisphaera salicampi]OXU16140.1 hypothetical protein SMSP1_00080 [Sedimentisphaera salicampi]